MPAGIEGAFKRLTSLVLPSLNCFFQANILTGTSVGGDISSKVAAIGPLRRMEYLMDRFFKESPDREFMGLFPIWEMPFVLRTLRQETHMTVVCTDKLTARHCFGADCLMLPEWLDSKFAVPDGMKELLRRSKSVKEDMRIYRRSDFSTEHTRKIDDFDRFYHKMYVPFAKARHGERAVLRDYYHLKRSLRLGGLINILIDGIPAAGIIYEDAKSEVKAVAVGMIDGDWEPVRKGAMTAVYLALIHQAQKRGYDHVDFGGCRAFLNDGLLRYKRKWRMSVSEWPDSRFVFLLYWNSFNSPVSSFISHNPMIVRHKMKYYGIMNLHHLNSIDEKEIERIKKIFWIPGLNKMCFIAPAGTAFEYPSSPEIRIIKTAPGTSLDSKRLRDSLNE